MAALCAPSIFLPSGKNGVTLAYTVLARRYRSQSFDEVVGQEAVARTLETAIGSDRVGHAYLFCGTRGVGKTTMARLFAAEINTRDGLESADAIREAVMRGEDLDVIEIDGASNRGVQEARDLIANAGLAPTRCRYKIYIIDEVHMLTTESFNTLLKTMEEPPPHVKFILCTTEPNKVLHTIQSRCQRFDFRPIPSSKITDHLRDVLSKEGVEADDEVISRVAELGNGSMRDALSVLERLLAAGSQKLEASVMDQVLGLPNQQRVGEIIDSILEGDPANALASAASLLSDGTSLDQLMECLVSNLRSLLLIVTCGPETELLEITDAFRAQLKSQSAQLDAEGTLHLLALCEHASRSARLSASARAVFDATIVRMALAEKLADVQSLLAGRKSAPASPPAQKKSSRTPEVKPVSKTEKPAVSKPAPVAPSVKSPLGDAEEIWAKVRDLASSPSLKAKVGSFEPIEIVDGVLHLRLLASSGGGYLADTVDSLLDLVSEAAGRRLRLKVVGSEKLEPAVVERPGSTKSIDGVQDDPAVKIAADLMQAIVVDVEKNAGSNEAKEGSR
ncbi:MAG: DNA polymerase III, subunit gamma and tau [Phycisphaerae bacterium]|nr:DNA polymerase III, subunit gamma and tau [Phycisphaerae bacterium]